MSTRMTLEEQTQVKALLAVGFSPTAIGKRLNRDHKTIAVYAKKPDTVSEVYALKEDLADSFEELARRMIESITDDDITEINAYQRTIAAAAATDKMRLLRNQSTDNLSMIFSLIRESSAVVVPDVKSMNDDNGGG